ncbi:hypothetical protein BDQ94DRAFT_140486 [Aspergillus welwitschiae]|uniref:Secreted protein n=1 Tax=Aspergillus welwitschiae TaxID=1341132 RepID=A0A3F3Q7N7_9EURO|nr:hypothetical protein BDQ94DRAFT_140486 [Aspergillus welwitschiae]RDH35244.1 hypothetical protein BDQ94DRAFT_140486 [Aspergillus welwitschiae]
MPTKRNYLFIYLVYLGKLLGMVFSPSEGGGLCTVDAFFSLSLSNYRIRSGSGVTQTTYLFRLSSLSIYTYFYALC